MSVVPVFEENLDDSARSYLEASLSPESRRLLAETVVEWWYSRVDVFLLTLRIHALLPPNQAALDLLSGLNNIFRLRGPLPRLYCALNNDQDDFVAVVSPTGSRIAVLSQDPSSSPLSWAFSTEDLDQQDREVVSALLSTQTAKWAIQLLYIELKLRYGETHRQERKRCVKLLHHLVQKFGVLPPSLYLRNVTRDGHDPIRGGSYADIFRGYLKTNQLGASLESTVVCLKALRTFQIYDEKELQKILKEFCNEAFLWTQLEHPNILPCFGISTSVLENRLCLISPWMSNGTILEFLRRNPQHDRLTAILDIANGLTYLHGLEPQIVHGDVKGVNILVMEDNRCCLADFGLALMIETHTMVATGTSVRGTTRWSAPELFRPADDPSSPLKSARDIYAYACTVLEIYTGRPPFSDPKISDAAVMLQVIEGKRPSRPKEMQPAFFDDVWKMLEECWAEDSRSRPLATDIAKRLERKFQLVSSSSTSPHTLADASSSGSHRRKLSNADAEIDSISIPPSPTLSHRSSLHFQTSLALRDNKVDPKSATSLDLLSPVGASSSGSRRRKLSNASTAETVPDTHRNESDLQDVSTRATSISHVDTPGRHLQDTRRTVDYSDATVAVSEKRKPKTDEKRFKRKRDQVELVQTAQDEDLDPSPFPFKPFQLARMLDSKDLDALEAIGGVNGLVAGLGTNRNVGLSTNAQTHNDRGPGDGRPSVGQGFSHRHGPENGSNVVHENDFYYDSSSASLDDRRRVYGANVLPSRKSKSLLKLMLSACKDKVLILLSIAAIISWALSFFQDFGPAQRPDEPGAIMVAVFIMVIVRFLNDWQKERQFKALNEKKEKRGAKVIRDGLERVIGVKQVLVGDIALLEPGEIVPCDGVFLTGHNVKCDESDATGELDAIKKVSYEECVALRQQRTKKKSHELDCFIVSGSKVLEGVGKYVVVAVGQKSFNGRIMMALRGDAENTPLQTKLNALAELIAKLGGAAGVILFVALLIRFFVQIGAGNPPRTPNEKGIAFVNILIIAVTVIVVAVPEGLLLAVTLALAFATKRMTYEKLLVRVPGSCEMMANASVICTDKTGTLTQNDMTVVAGSVGIHAKFVRRLEENQTRTNADQVEDTGTRKHYQDFSLDQSKLDTVLSPQLRALFNEAIAVNSTVFREGDDESGNPIFVGSKTETALLKFTHEMKWQDFRGVRDSADIIQMIPFSSERKAMGVVIKLPDGRFRVHLKGASEILSKKCKQHAIVYKDGPPTSSQDIETAPIDELAADNISRTIIFYANQTLRTIALCYRDFDTWPPSQVQLDEEREVPYDDLAKDLILIAITGIEDPLREGVRDAVSKCHRAGVMVKMCTADNVLTARSIASQCGIFSKGGIIMEGHVFRNLSQLEMIEVIPRLQVLARSSPEDKKILVKTLKRIGEIVCVTGDGTNDVPALTTANIGFSMGITGNEVTKEASDIVLMDDNFASIVKAIIWGRCVNDAVRKFLQLQISAIVTTVIITFVTAVASEREASVLSAVQLFWINIIINTFAALALATDPASESLLDRKPDKRNAPLFSVEMYKQILLQSVYQIAIILIYHFLGERILSTENDRVVQTLAFNAFVFAQIFNSVNCRRLDRKLNVFEGILRNWYFIAITLIEIVGQVIIVFVGGVAFQVTRIGGREWGISLVLGVVSIPLGALIRLLPSVPFEKVFRKVGLLGREEQLPTTSPEAEQGWSGAISLVRDNLGTFANLRGGRLRSSFVSAEQPPMRLFSSILTMAPTLMAGAVATGHTYLDSPSNPPKSSAVVWEVKLQIHPDTPPDDPVYQRFAGRKEGRNICTTWSPV